jgi:arginine deiminase
MFHLDESRQKSLLGFVYCDENEPNARGFGRKMVFFGRTYGAELMELNSRCYIHGTEFMELNIQSEIGFLNRVVVHTPGHEMSMVNPDDRESMLFDDIIYEEDAREEHLNMLRVFRAVMGQEGHIHEIVDLLNESLAVDGSLEAFKKGLVSFTRMEDASSWVSWLADLPLDETVRLCLEGSHPALKHRCFAPIPNLLFTRDLASVSRSTLVVSSMSKDARRRESYIMRHIANWHPMFKPLQQHLLTLDKDNLVEGGDILTVSDRVVLIGLSERTSISGVMQVAQELLGRGVDTVLAIDIPKRRSSMHLDTIFTFVSEDECVAYTPVIEHKASQVIGFQMEGTKLCTTSFGSLTEALKHATGTHYRIIPCGGDDPVNQSREQWTDGANLFALAPGVVLGYARNQHTFAAMERAGYNVMTQNECLEQAKHDGGQLHIGTEKLAISFEGHELCRGRGGARCMTMPLSRRPIQSM